MPITTLPQIAQIDLLFLFNLVYWALQSSSLVWQLETLYPRKLEIALSSVYSIARLATVTDTGYPIAVPNTC